jgi:hypothetical protein
MFAQLVRSFILTLVVSFVLGAIGGLIFSSTNPNTDLGWDGWWVFGTLFGVCTAISHLVVEGVGYAIRALAILRGKRKLTAV